MQLWFILTTMVCVTPWFLVALKIVSPRRFLQQHWYLKAQSKSLRGTPGSRRIQTFQMALHVVLATRWVQRVLSGVTRHLWWWVLGSSHRLKWKVGRIAGSEHPVGQKASRVPHSGFALRKPTEAPYVSTIQFRALTLAHQRLWGW